MHADGGLPVTVADSLVGNAGTTWAVDGFLYADGAGSVSLFKVPAGGGGVPEQASTLDTDRGETNHFWPEAIPSGRGLLFTVGYAGDEPPDVAVLDLSTGMHRVLVRGSYPRYSSTGHILYVTNDGTLWAAPFDENNLELTGASFPVADGLELRGNADVDLALSNTGTLMYTIRTPPREVSELVWVTRDGSATVLERSAGQLWGPALSPNGTLLAVQNILLGAGSRRIGLEGAEIWIKLLPDGPFRQFTLLGGRQPAWSPGGDSIVFTSNRIAISDAWVRPVDGASEATLLHDGASEMLGVSYSPDGSWIVYTEVGTLYAARVGADASERTMLAENAGIGAISRNGRWVAYASARSGRSEVYVRSFPEGSGTELVAQGSDPLWARGGDELFYRSGGSLVAAEVSTDPSFSVRRQEELFSLDGLVGRYDVDLDDRRFLMVRRVQRVSSTPSLVVVLNFTEELQRLTRN